VRSGTEQSKRPRTPASGVVRAGSRRAGESPLMGVLIVTGTGTDVGKTVATAAIAACATGSVAVVKPAQTGVSDGEPGDLAEVTRLSGVADVHEFVRYPDPLSPHHAAQRSGRPPLDRATAVERIRELATARDTVIVEGAGGVLVPFAADDPWTVLDLGRDLDARFVLVTRAGLGTLNDTALAAERVGAAHVVVGSWPRQPDLAMRCNLDDLAAMSGGGELAGVLPAAMTEVTDFRATAAASLAPQLGGTFDGAAFRAAHRR
jgi:dethiobiotin synthetase